MRLDPSPSLGLSDAAADRGKVRPQATHHDNPGDGHGPGLADFTLSGSCTSMVFKSSGEASSASERLSEAGGRGVQYCAVD